MHLTPVRLYYADGYPLKQTVLEPLDQIPLLFEQRVSKEAALFFVYMGPNREGVPSYEEIKQPGGQPRRRLD